MHYCNPESLSRVDVDREDSIQVFYGRDIAGGFLMRQTSRMPTSEG
jgi:hypothetical protein